MPTAEVDAMEQTETECLVTPFEVEADHPRNCELLLQCIPNARLRSAFDGMKANVDSRGRPSVPVDQALMFASFPRLPGMRLLINPKELKYVISDPLHGDSMTCESVRQWMAQYQPMKTGTKVDGVPPQSGTLDVHRMKSLCREITTLVKDGQMKLVRGVLPTEEEVATMPGKFLLNPGSTVQNGQPRYEEDYEAWLERLHTRG